jgi:hypothetical protein
MPTIVTPGAYQQNLYIPPSQIRLYDPTQIDMFGRLRVSDPATIFNSTVQSSGWYDLQWWKQTTNGFFEYHNPNASTLQIGVGSASGDRYVLQSKRYMFYQPGKSQVILMTASIDDNRANCYKYYGYGDDYNGVFFRVTDGEIALVRRSYSNKTVQTSGNQFQGTPDEEVVYQNPGVGQTGFSYDRANGTNDPVTNRTGLNLSDTNALIFWFGIEWLGVGTVACGVIVDQTLYLLHQFHHSNRAQSTYMTRGSLPIRYEIKNTAATTGNTYTRVICSTVISEGGQDRAYGYNGYASNKVSYVNVGTGGRPILSIRPKITISNLNDPTPIDNILNHSEYDLIDAIVANEGSNAHIELRYYPEATYVGAGLVGFTGANFTQVGTSTYKRSTMEYDVNCSAVTGVNYIEAGGFPVLSGGNNSPTSATLADLSKYPLGINIDGTKGSVIQLFATSQTGTTDVSGTLLWREIH